MNAIQLWVEYIGFGSSNTFPLGCDSSFSTLINLDTFEEHMNNFWYLNLTSFDQNTVTAITLCLFVVSGSEESLRAYRTITNTKCLLARQWAFLWERRRRFGNFCFHIKRKLWTLGIVFESLIENWLLCLQLQGRKFPKTLWNRWTTDPKEVRTIYELIRRYCSKIYGTNS